MATDITRQSPGIKNLIVVSKDDWGIPHKYRDLAKFFKPVDVNKSTKAPNKYWGFYKGHEYEYSGEESRLKEVYPASHPKKGKPKGWAELFEIKGAK